MVERVDPGPHEDGNYLGLLARQAASVELHLLRSLPDEAIAPALDSILLGTTGRPTSDAKTVGSRHSASIRMSAGMIYLLYQTSKAVVFSWKPVPAPPGSLVSFSSKLEDSEEIIRSDPRPTDMMWRILSSWLFDGIARPPDSAPPPPTYSLPLDRLTTYAERFVVAHEYGHALMDLFRMGIPPWSSLEKDFPDARPEDLPFLRENRADAFGTMVVVGSSSALDRTAPNMALQGAALAMKVHEIADRAIDLANGGNGDPPWSSTSHSPFHLRTELLMRTYSQMVEGLPDPRLGEKVILFPAHTAELLWTQIRPRLIAALNMGATLHSIWSAP